MLRRWLGVGQGSHLHRQEDFADFDW
ncbi:hypothetical protein PanWU01x14_051240 [Parasponia andersonii]|uniref:Uncharacterized protein n=1 Tax=Parasponia andersonii TaxID=3476 RepID=A0A2P5DLW7_PARAD|nr:hypothetical protein PanWU01x14_051240 [Parasponia andersonii]